MQIKDLSVVYQVSLPIVNWRICITVSYVDLAQVEVECVSEDLVQDPLGAVAQASAQQLRRRSGVGSALTSTRQLRRSSVV